MHVNHIKNTEKLTQNLEDKQRENAYLYEEIRERRNQKEEFERSCKENCQRKFEEVVEEKKNAIEEITKEMNLLKEDLDDSKIKEIENYNVEKKKKEGDKIVLSYYEDENKIYKYDLDKLNKYNILIGKEIDLNGLMNLILFFPIKLIKFHCKVYSDPINLIAWKKFIVAYTYPIYKDIISIYINIFNKTDYNENKKYKPGKKRDI